MLKAAITTTTFGEYDKSPVALLKKQGFKVLLNNYGRKLKKAEILSICKDAVGVIVGTEKWDAGILKKLPKLRAISRCGAGLDNIDLDAAKSQGIKVLNTPDVLTQAVAELTVGLILNLLRRINQADSGVKKGEWEKLMGNLLGGKKIGIIGFGRIGKRVAELLTPFNCDAAYYDPFPKNRLVRFRRMSKGKLLAWADIITLHASAKRRILGVKEFKLMKKGAWLINVSRGEALDETALHNALKKGRLRGAALDVFQQEPYSGKLAKSSNIILTPHIGSYAKESRIIMEKVAVENLLKALKEISSFKGDD